MGVEGFSYGRVSLAVDPQQPEAKSKPVGDEHGFIVRS